MVYRVTHKQQVSLLTPVFQVGLVSLRLSLLPRANSRKYQYLPMFVILSLGRDARLFEVVKMGMFLKFKFNIFFGFDSYAIFSQV